MTLVDRAFLSLLLVGMLSLTACQSKGDAPAAKADPDTPAETAADPLQLTDDQVQHLALTTAPLVSGTHLANATGYGAVVPRLTLVSAIAEANTSRGAARQSEAVLQRARSLADTAGAYSTDTLQGLERQAAADAAAAELAGSRLSATVGDVGSNENLQDATLQLLERGELLLIRVTFPLQSVWSGPPATLEIQRLDATPQQHWVARRVWPAPADPTLPGRSFFALLNKGTLADGERVLARAAEGAPEAGVVVPAAAVVIFDGDSWCYVERQPNHFARVKLEADEPIDNGYFVTAGVKAGDKVVTHAAALLLAKETGAGSDDAE